MKPGSSDSDAAFGDSLAEEIDNALKMEWLAIKKQPLPDAGKDDRRLLFAAIAQGVLNYLLDHSAELQIKLTPGAPMNLGIQITSPNLQLLPLAGNPNEKLVSGTSFQAGGNVTVTWDDPVTINSITADANGNFSLNLGPPAGAGTGRHIIEARDGVGNVAMAVFVI
jgi:hypothetical protein